MQLKWVYFFVTCELAGTCLETGDNSVTDIFWTVETEDVSGIGGGCPFCSAINFNNSRTVLPTGKIQNGKFHHG